LFSSASQACNFDREGAANADPRIYQCGQPDRLGGVPDGLTCSSRRRSIRSLIVASSILFWSVWMATPRQATGTLLHVVDVDSLLFSVNGPLVLFQRGFRRLGLVGC